MMSDSESSSDALLFGTSSGLTKVTIRKRAPAASRAPAAAAAEEDPTEDDDDDDLIRSALKASQATFALETERRRRESSLSSGAATALATTTNPPVFTEESEEDELDVLQPQDCKPVMETKSSVVAFIAAAVASKAPDAPRLSYSGAAPDDPVALDDDDDDEDDEDCFLQEQLKDDDNIPSYRLETKPAAREYSYTSSPCTSPESITSSQNGATRKVHARPVVQNKRFDPPAGQPVAKKPMSSFSDDSDDDDSLDDLLLPLGTKRTRLSQASSSDSDDDFFVQSKKQKKKAAVNKKMSSTSSVSSRASNKESKLAAAAAKRAVAQAKKEEREARKRQDELAKQARQRQRTAKKVATEAAKESRKRNRVQAAQARGRHADKEIVVLADGSILHHQVLPVTSELQEAGYMVQEYASGLGCCALQFIRKDYVKGGAEKAWENLRARRPEEDAYQHLPVMAIVFDVPHDFIDLLGRKSHDEDEDYPLLEEWLRGVQEGWRVAWKMPPGKRPRIILLLNKVMEALDKLWINKNKRKPAGGASRNLHKNANAHETTPSLPTAEELHDAVTWMLIQFQVECVFCATTEELTNHLKKMTRMLSEEPYQRVVTELECIKKLKAQVSDMADPYDRAVDCWMRQVQQIPRVSLSAASVLIQYYPTAQSLWEAYQNDDLTLSERQALLANALCQSRSQVKLSSWIHTVMTSTDPNELLR